MLGHIWWHCLRGCGCPAYLGPQLTCPFAHICWHHGPQPSVGSQRRHISLTVSCSAHKLLAQLHGLGLMLTHGCPQMCGLLLSWKVTSSVTGEPLMLCFMF